MTIAVLDSVAGMGCLFESQRPGDSYRGRAYECSGPQGLGAEDHGLLGDPALRSPSPGESGFVSSAGREGVFAQAWACPERTRASIAESIQAARRVRIPQKLFPCERGVHDTPLGVARLEKDGCWFSWLAQSPVLLDALNATLQQAPRYSTSVE